MFRKQRLKEAKSIEMNAIMMDLQACKISFRNMPYFAMPTKFCGPEYHQKGMWNF